MDITNDRIVSDEEILEVQQLIQMGKFNEATDRIIQLEDLGINNRELVTMKAVISMMDNRLYEAEKILVEAGAIYYDFYDVFYNLGHLFTLKNSPAVALAYYKRALKLANNLQEKQTASEQISKLESTIEMQQRKPKVSIIVLAYNHLEYTKLCVESIYKHTSHIDFELITVNNGSSDDTRAYFDQLPNVKKINLDLNVGPVNGFNVGMMAAEGEFTACVCNDFIFTPRWMDNLLICIESDERIGFVSPGASNVSNAQEIAGKFETLEDIEAFAEKYNQSNPKKWEERVRLLPCVLMVRTGIFDQIGYFDPRFYFGEFADDDISFRIRRAGYKLIFAKDTFTFHFGSVTTGKDHVEKNSLGVSREIFKDKYGFDVWRAANMDFNIVNSITPEKKDVIKILAIDAKCGAIPLQLKNYLKENGVTTVSITNYTEEQLYIEDLNTVSDFVQHGEINEIVELDGEYDYILMPDGFEKYKEFHNILDNISMKLSENGKIIFYIKNPSNFEVVKGLITGGFPVTEQTPFISYLNIQVVFDALAERNMKLDSCIAVQAGISKDDQPLLEYLVGLNKSHRDNLLKLLSIHEYLIVASA